MNGQGVRIGFNEWPGAQKGGHRTDTKGVEKFLQNKVDEK